MNESRRWGFSWVVVTYLLGMWVAWWTAGLMGGGPDLRLGAASFAATLLVFAVGHRLGNASLYDPYWSVYPPLAGFWLLFWPGDAHPVRGILALVLVCVWSGRLTANWAIGWAGIAHQDWRYLDLASKTGEFYPWVNLGGIHLFPSFMTWVGTFGLTAAMATGGAPMNAWDPVAAAVMVAGILLEAIADEQMRAFRAENTDPDRVMDRGLWAYSRHPNYLGEILFWLGLGLFGVAAGGGASMLLAPALMLAMFLGVSIPMMETRQGLKAGWASYARRVPSLIPGWR